mmetsp:Transcript_43707/g.105413  ORF Transcript_43707/g.105413 Transcript_43707/m.105413 type:complete len:280 (+) Transcript_43707:56-895(+)
MAQNPLLGNRISLISKKNIRYEGILYSINEADSTLALQNVRAFGTEGREKVDSSNYIGPQDAVHPYLLFRGCDIKDLHVHESKTKVEKTTASEAAHKTMRTNVTVSDESNTQPQFDSSVADGKADAQSTQKTKTTKVEQGAGGHNGSSNTKKSRKSNPVHQVGTGASLLSRKARGSVTVGTLPSSRTQFKCQSSSWTSNRILLRYFQCLKHLAKNSIFNRNWRNSQKMNQQKITLTTPAIVSNHPSHMKRTTFLTRFRATRWISSTELTIDCGVQKNEI